MPVHIIGFDGSPFAGGTCATILKRALQAAEGTGATTELIRLKDVIQAPFHGVHNPVQVALKSAFDALPLMLRRLTPATVKRIATSNLFPAEIKQLIDKIEEADGFIFASPTWWSTPSDYIKILLNYLTICDYRDYSLKGKVAGLIGVCEEDGAQHANMLLQNALTHMGLVTPPFGSFFFNRNMEGASEEDWQQTDQELLGANVVRMALLLKQANWDWNNV
jgi:multimeric flavodoxin WrbA